MMDNRNGTDAALEFLRARLLWRRAELARVGALVQGERLLDEVLSELDAAERTEKARLLKLSEASRLCGYSPDHLRVLIKAGKLTDHGRPHAPLVRRDELPRKPGHSAPALTPARAVANLKAQIVGHAIPSALRRHNGIPA
jgi:hypothetical protein